jgi:N-acetylmuramic acid 6-phosphate etherase
VDNTMVVGIIAGGDGALRNAIEGAEDSEELAIQNLTDLGVNEKDVVVAISASGTAPYCVGALKKAKEAPTIPLIQNCGESQYVDE